MDIGNLDEFSAGLGFGAVGVGLLLLVYLFVGVGRRRPLPLAGVLIAAGGLLSIGQTRTVPSPVLVGVLGTAAAATLAALPGVSLWFSFALKRKPVRDADLNRP